MCLTVLAASAAASGLTGVPIIIDALTSSDPLMSCMCGFCANPGWFCPILVICMTAKSARRWVYPVTPVGCAWWRTTGVTY